MTLVLATLLLAMPATAKKYDFTGFHVGASLGYATGSQNFEINDGDSIHRSDLSTKGTLGGIFIGLGKQFQNDFYIGLEAEGNITNVDGNDRRTLMTLTTTNDLSLENSLSLNLRAGKLFDRLMFYVKGGGVTSGWKLDSKNITGGTRNTNSKRLTGYQLGAGFDYLMNKHAFVGLAYTHTAYTNSIETDLTDMTTTSKASPCTNDVRLRVGWKF